MAKALPPQRPQQPPLLPKLREEEEKRRKRRRRSAESLLKDRKQTRLNEGGEGYAFVSENDG